MSLGDSLTWGDWVRLVASELGVHGLTDRKVETLLWEYTPYPHAGPLAIRPALMAALLGAPDCPCCGGVMTSDENADMGVCGECKARMGW